MGHHIEDLLAYWQQAPQDEWVLAVITDIQGSAYRKPGAIMLFHALGHSFGLLSGGCLEADLRRHAQKALQTQTVQRLVYDATDESDTSYQLGCGGIVSIMLVPLSAENQFLQLDELANGLRHFKQGFYQIALAPQGASAASVSGRFWVDNDTPFPVTDFTQTGHFIDSICDSRDHNELDANLQSTLQTAAHYLVIPMRRKYHLGVFGGGIDAQPLVSMAIDLGWKVTVFDERTAYARAYDFARASVVHQASDSLDSALLASLDAAMVMHHNIRLDAKALACLQPLSLDYVGLLGPGHRRDKVLNLANLNIIDFQQALFAPAGLALGGELPSSIALSILSQCHGVLYKASLGELVSVMK